MRTGFPRRKQGLAGISGKIQNLYKRRAEGVEVGMLGGEGFLP